jgi:hypothetical protein
MSMTVSASDQIADWIATYGDDDAAVVWQRCMDAGILTTKTILFNIVVLWARPNLTDENEPLLESLVRDGIITEDFYPVTKTGEVIRWGIAN